MDCFIINGNKQLNGEVHISGAKNAALPIMAATLLTNQKCIIHNVPDLTDVHLMARLLYYLGSEVKWIDKHTLEICLQDEENIEAPYDVVKAMRASICVLGTILAKRKRARVPLPGGCVIGDRPIDLHLMGLRKMGAEIKLDRGYILAEAKKLKGTQIFLANEKGSTVTGTANILMAATLAEGKTVIEQAAREPEIVNLADFLIKMGAKIKGAGTPVIEIEGVSELRGAEINLIPDRIEAGTFLIAGAITRGKVSAKGVIPEHLTSVLGKLSQIGFKVETTDNMITIDATDVNNLTALDLVTAPYPGFPTDLQAPMVALLCTVPGISSVSEKIFPERFMHIPELRRLGADIKKELNTVYIKGGKTLCGASVVASDIRGGAGLILACLAAQGQSKVQGINHIDRGYEEIEVKLQKLGADIRREVVNRELLPAKGG